MKQFTLNINAKYQRPIVELKSWHNFEALLDTGAFFPFGHQMKISLGC